MIKYYMGAYNQLSIAKETVLSTEHDKINIHMYYSEFVYTPAGANTIVNIHSWKNAWRKLDTKGKTNIIKRKFKAVK